MSLLLILILMEGFLGVLRNERGVLRSLFHRRGILIVRRCVHLLRRKRRLLVGRERLGLLRELARVGQRRRRMSEMLSDVAVL